MTRAPLVRLGRKRLAAVPNPDPEPPACNLLTRGGKWCVLDTGHRWDCISLPADLPLPHNYPPKPLNVPQRPYSGDGGPSVTEYLRSRGDLA